MSMHIKSEIKEHLQMYLSSRAFHCEIFLKTRLIQRNCVYVFVCVCVCVSICNKI
jgi:hypothetical protein